MQDLPSPLKQTAKQQATEALVTAHLPLVRRMAQHLHSKLPNVDVEDLNSAGIFGLLEAAKRYDSQNGCAFESFAYPRIHGAMIDSVRAVSPLSRTLRDKGKKIEQTTSRLAQSFGRMPGAHEVSAAMELPLSEYHAILCDLEARRSVSLDETAPDRFSGIHPNDIPDPAALSPLALLEEQECSARLSRAIALLPERNQQIISLYYLQGRTMKQIGAELHLHESCISKLHAKSLLALRSTMSARTKSPGPSRASAYQPAPRAAERFESALARPELPQSTLVAIEDLRFDAIPQAS